MSPSKHDKGFDPTNPLRKVNRKTGGINASPPRHKVRTSPNSRVRAVISPASAKAGPSQKASKEFNKPAPTVPTALPSSPEPTKDAPEWMRGRDPAGSPLFSRAAKDRVNDMFAKSPDPRLNQVFGSTYTGIEARPRPLVDGDRFTSAPQTRQPWYLSATLRVAGQRPAHAGYAAGCGATRGASTIGGEEAVRTAAASPRRARGSKSSLT